MVFKVLLIDICTLRGYIVNYNAKQGVNIMIKYFKVENFKSIATLQELNLVSAKKNIDLNNSFYKEDESNYISKINCIVGSNASGKSTVLEALSFFIEFMQNSFQYDKNLLTSFFPHSLYKNKPSKFELVFTKDSNLFQLKLEILNGNIIYEELGVKIKRGFSYIYKKEFKNEKVVIKFAPDSKINLSNNEENRFLKKHKHASFFSFLTASEYLDKYDITKIVPEYSTSATNIGRQSYNHILTGLQLSKEFEQEIEMMDFVTPYLQNFDLGIKEMSLDKATISADIAEITKQKILTFTHFSEQKYFDLSILSESGGTVAGLSLLTRMYKVFKNGGILIADEIEDSLHPDICSRLISLFANPEVNPHNAQLIFSTHQHLFLNDRAKSQIFFTEKNNANTELYRLDSIEGIRNETNFYKAYKRGELGATPRIGLGI